MKRVRQQARYGHGAYAAWNAGNGSSDNQCFLERNITNEAPFCRGSQPVFKRPDADFGAHPRFRFDLDVAGRIVAYQNDHEPRGP